MRNSLLFVGVLFAFWFNCAHSWGNSNQDRVLLSDVKSITLERGKMTNGRRSSPVSQLSCVGGSAGCHAFQPVVVQCLNQGSDGYDAQWECKADMDAAYRFGRIQVSCEGYDYPEDPYILRGSCGLEYEIDLTDAGRHGGGGGGGGHYYGNNYSYNQGSGFGVGKIFQLIVAAAVFYAIYKCCCVGNRHHMVPTPAPTTTTTTSGSGVGGQGMGGAGAGGGPGFFTGAATGGLLGYLFGNRGGGYGRGYGGGYGRGYGGGYGYGTGYGGSSWSARPSTGWSSGWSSGTRRSGSSSSGSRTTSGFGGTSRR